MHRFALAAALVAALSGCASPVTRLTDATGAIEMEDAAPISSRSASKVRYQFMEGSAASVGMSIAFARTESTSGFIVNVILKNTSKAPAELRPSLTLQDRDGLVKTPYTYDAFARHAARLAGIQVPAVAAVSSRTQVHRGTMEDQQTGRRYDYSGTSRARGAGFADGFAAGLAQGDAAAAAGAKREGAALLRWADTYWLRENYHLEPGQAVSAVVVFPTTAIGSLPATVSVTVNGELFTFKSAPRP